MHRHHPYNLVVLRNEDTSTPPTIVPPESFEPHIPAMTEELAMWLIPFLGAQK